MGACGSAAAHDMPPGEYAGQVKNSRAIDSDNQKSWTKETQVKKLLLLGAGESGKSTLFKQMMQLYGGGYSQHDRTIFRMPIYNSTVSSMKTLVRQCDKLLAANEKHKKYLCELKLDSIIDMDIARAIRDLWGDPAIQKAWLCRAVYQLPDSINYFFQDVERIATDSYIPSYEDLLRVRVRTTGIVESNFTISGSRFRMIDVGGQRNERKKWIHCFEDVTGVIFVAAISEYDQMLYEDETTNRMDEAIDLFEEICNSRWFRDTSMILFLNKKDLFEEKIKRVPLTSWCPKFAGDPHDYDETTTFLKEKFTSKNKSKDKRTYTHFCCAVDVRLVDDLFITVKDIIIRRSLREAQLD